MHDVHVAIIGAGFTGIGAAIRLHQHGITDVVLLERADTPGGTWRDNHYPGCACDVPSRLYSFSFAQNPGWSRKYSGQAEIQRYLCGVADTYGITPRMRFGHAMHSARWNDRTQRWHIDTSGGTYSARVLLLATGALSDPAWPAIPGRDEFAGPAFHSAQWRHDVSLAGKRVAVIGTGASAIQFVPAIQPQVGALTVFQRTPPWIVPRHDRAVSAFARFLFRAVPGLQSFVRGVSYVAHELTFLPFRYRRIRQVTRHLALRHLAAQVADPVLRARLTPTYDMGCKRVLVSDDFYPALTKPNVRLETSAIEGIVPNGVRTQDGTVHEADVLIFGTGFRPTDPPLAPFVTGRDGNTLADAWRHTLSAYASTTIHGFPNLFVIPGPNAGLGHSSMIYMIESQIAHLVAALDHMARRAIGALEPTRDAQHAWTREVDARMQHMVWVEGGCASWYLDRGGRNSTLWPGFTFAFRRAVTHFRPEHYHGVPVTSAATSPIVS
jgi:cation diffusion facilitator CzcD-associated flavoprotein CzcO